MLYSSNVNIFCWIEINYFKWSNKYLLLSTSQLLTLFPGSFCVGDIRDSANTNNVVQNTDVHSENYTGKGIILHPWNVCILYLIPKLYTITFTLFCTFCSKIGKAPLGQWSDCWSWSAGDINFCNLQGWLFRLIMLLFL